VKKIVGLALSMGLCAVSAGAIAQTITQQSNTPAHLDGNQAVLDWSGYTMGDIPQLPDGTTFSDSVTVGDYPAVGEMSLGQVSPNSSIGEVQGLNNVRLGDLTESVPGLADKKVSDSPAIGKIVENYALQKGLQVGFHYADKYIGKLFNEIPELKGLPLGQFSQLLNGDPLSAIPGLSETALDKIPGLDKVALSKIPGLDKIPLSKIMSLAKYSPVAILDSTWSKEESKSLFKPVSGSKEEGWEVPCNQSNCSYIELSDFRGSLAMLPYHGARWIVGGPKIKEGQQMVKGGSGILGAAFGGKEPTGRPLGNDLKIVLTKVDQSKGEVYFSLYTHACTKHSGCTPFIIGPLGEGIPFLTAKETGLVFMGILDYKGAKSKMPKWASDKISAIQNKYEPPTEGGGGDNQDTSVSDCAQKALGVVDPSKTSAASSSIPTLIKESLNSGLDANQTAFLVAVADEKYNFNIDSSALISQYGQIAKKNITSKSVDYFSASSSAGLSSDVASKASQYQTALKPCQNASCSASGRMTRPSSGVVVSEMGMRFHPILHTWKLHAGIDLGDGVGAPIRAADCGTVAYVGDESGYGHVVIIKHGRYFTRHAHLSAQSVHTGQVVQQGQLVGRAGASGRVTGPHLHFEVRDGGSFGPALNPRQFIGF
jgi:murein DD-endopeptidase MepM/ murein hydrolase activator NlpD